MSPGEVRSLFLTGRFSGENRIVPAQVSVFGKVQKKMASCKSYIGK